MNVRKMAWMLTVAASCTGCVTETKNLGLTGNVEKVKDANIKETEYAKRNPQPLTWVALGDLEKAKLVNQKLPAAEQNACRDEARKAYQKAIECDPKCVKAYSHLAALYAEVDDMDRAAEVYQRGVQTNPQSAILWHEQGLVHCRRKDYNSALQCLGKAHELEPQKPDYGRCYGYLLAWTSKPQDAVVVLSRVMGKSEANYQVARMMAHLNQPEASRQYLTVSLRESPANHDALALLAQLNTPRGSQTAPVASINFDPAFQQASMQTPR